MIFLYKWHVLQELKGIHSHYKQHSFQTQLQGINKLTPLVFVMWLGNGFQEELTLLQYTKLPSWRGEQRYLRTVSSQKIPATQCGSQKCRLLF
jgi:hypothetical protein